MSWIAFRCRLDRDEDGVYVATFPDLPFGATDGATVDEALKEAADCLETILAVLVEEEREIPHQAKLKRGEYLVSPSAVTAAQVALYSAMRQEHVTPSDLAKRLHVPVAEVRSLIDLANYPPLETIERALAALGHRLTVALDAAE